MKKMTTLQDKNHNNNLEISEKLRWSTDEEVKKYIDKYAYKESEAIEVYIELHTSINTKIENMSIYDYFTNERKKQFNGLVERIKENKRVRQLKKFIEDMKGVREIYEYELESFEKKKDKSQLTYICIKQLKKDIRFTNREIMKAEKQL